MKSVVSSFVGITLEYFPFLDFQNYSVGFL